MAQIQTFRSCVGTTKPSLFDNKSFSSSDLSRACKAGLLVRPHAPCSFHLASWPRSKVSLFQRAPQTVSAARDSRSSLATSTSSSKAPLHCMPLWRPQLAATTGRSGARANPFFLTARAQETSRGSAMSAPADVEVSPPWRPALGDIVIEPTEKHTATVVFLHGLGDSGRGWAEMVPAFGLKHVKWILPSAETRPITINGGFPMNGWFDVLGLGPSTKEDVRGLDRAAAHVISLLAKENAKEGPESSVRYAVGGFSQGGSLALHVATSLAYGRYLDAKPAPRVPLAAAACISGWLSGSDVLAKGRQNLDAEALERASRLPILHCHGKVDPVVNFQFGKLTGDTLKGTLGFSKTTFKAYDGVGHHVNPQEVADIKAWLLEQLPPA